MAQGYANRRVTQYVAPGWQDWTPSYVNLTIGNGTVIARYLQIGTIVFYYFEWTLGSTSAVDSAGSGTISAPVAASGANNYPQNVTGHAVFYNADGTDYVGHVRMDSATTLRPIVHSASGTYSAVSGINDTVPFTWTTSDQLIMIGMYEAASPADSYTEVNHYHNGIVGKTIWTSTLSNPGANDTDISGTELEVQMDSDKIYRISWMIQVDHTADARFEIALYDSADALKLGRSTNMSGTATAGYHTQYGAVIYTPSSSGVKQLALQIDSGYANITNFGAASTVPGHLIVERIG